MSTVIIMSASDPRMLVLSSLAKQILHFSDMEHMVLGPGRALLMSAAHREGSGNPGPRWAYVNPGGRISFLRSPCQPRCKHKLLGIGATFVSKPKDVAGGQKDVHLKKANHHTWHC
jgi:hypothetical protein